MALPGQCTRCGGLPGSIVRSVSAITARLGCPATGCWWCRHIPADLLTELEQLADREQET
jgi:hypothetical protein